MDNPDCLPSSPAFLIVCSCSLGREIKGAFRNWMSELSRWQIEEARQIGIKEWKKDGLCTGKLEIITVSRVERRLRREPKEKDSPSPESDLVSNSAELDTTFWPW